MQVPPAEARVALSIPPAPEPVVMAATEAGPFQKRRAVMTVPKQQRQSRLVQRATTSGPFSDSRVFTGYFDSSARMSSIGWFRSTSTV